MGPPNAYVKCLLILVTTSLFVDSLVLDKLRKAKCIVPKDTSSVTRAVLLQQCISADNAQGNETVCYEELGCFPMESPWTSLLRPLPSPMTPDEINVKLYMYTRNQPERYNVELWPYPNLMNSDYNPNRERTVFITHGFASDGNATWLDDMKNAYLDALDANVFLVDWGNGASKTNYLQVASNTRIVGAELGRFIKFLLNATTPGLDPKTLHLIGHSLGSHISGYTAKHVNEAGSGKVGRITALDPAQPAFEKEAKEVRLDVDDAEFVDALHTDAKPFIPLVGFGMLFPIGHVDFYLNGGTNQPGCYTNISHIPMNIKGITDLKSIPVEVINQWVSCSHGRSYQVFTQSLLPNVNCLWARKISNAVNALRVTSQGALRLLDPIIEKIENCDQESCTAVGFLTPDMKARGVFALSTTSKEPFCVSDEERDRKVKNTLTLGLYGIGSRLYQAGSTVAGGAYNAGAAVAGGAYNAGSRVAGGIASVGSGVGGRLKSVLG